MIPPEERDFVNEEVQNSWNGLPFEVEHRIIRPDGTETYVKEQALKTNILSVNLSNLK
ncbi:hypothetical protein [Bacillus sp. FJAT-45350]|uniref:hypothetical protein n=1 Tax=Bacillus sp. FJAT-45350 TaxID=2011014 RepID=UPI000BB87942|nr:hypothetical protein [Bacillus sp. FJAT-45350]